MRYTMKRLLAILVLVLLCGHMARPQQNPDSLDVDSAFVIAAGGDSVLAAQIMENALTRLAPGTGAYDSACAFLSRYYRGRNTDKYERFLSSYARSMVESGNFDAAYFVEVGEWRLQQHKYDEARECFDIAFRDANHLSPENLRVIAGGYRRLDQMSDENSGSAGKWMSAVLGVLLAVVAVVAVILSRRLRGCRKAQVIKEEVPQAHGEAAKAMFSLAIHAVEQFKEFNLLVERKLAAGQSKDLYATVSSGKHSSKVMEGFYSAFDERFLRAYPEFVSRLNGLLQPGKRFPAAEGTLTPELRIAAFIALGVSTSSNIASLLGLSLNTVYTYRNRLKGRVLDRENFEENLQNIIDFY